jgi:hypothetical protein
MHKGKVVPQVTSQMNKQTSVQELKECSLKSLQINHAIDFHSQYPVDPTTYHIKLKMNSANAAFCFYDTTNGDKLLIKVQLKHDSDPIIHDAVVNFTLNRILADTMYKPYKSFFMQVHASFIGLVKHEQPQLSPQQQKQTPQPMSYVVVQQGQPNPIETRPLETRPCVAVSRIENCYTFAQVLAGNWNQPTLPFKICQFINALLVLGNGVGFAHNDMHCGNVLYNMTEQHFVLIDYGRVHIYRHALLGGKELDVCISSIENIEKQKGIYLAKAWPIYNNYSTEIPGSFKIIKQKNSPKESLGMYVLNDLANQIHAVLAYMLNEKQIVGGPQQSDFVSFFTPFLTLYNYIDSTNITDIQPLEFAKVIKKAFDLRNDTHLLPFSLMVGYIWYILLKKTYKASGLSRIKNPLAVSNDYVFVVFPEIFEKLKGELTAIYIAIMKPIIRFWTTAYNSFYKKNVISGGGFGQEGEMESSATEWLMDVIDTKTYQNITNIPDKTNWLDKKLTISNMPKIDVDDDFLDAQFQKYITCFPVVPSKNSVGLQKPLIPLPPLPSNQIPIAAGGSNKRYYILKTEKKTCRRFVMCKGSKWYLDEHRGKYRYSLDKTSVAIC